MRALLAGLCLLLAACPVGTRVDGPTDTAVPLADVGPGPADDASAVADAEAAPPRDAGAPDGCTPETDSVLCARLGKDCGEVTADDACGSRRVVASCGGCAAPATCGGSGIANVCGLGSVTPTVLTLTDTVVTAGLKRIGVNLGDDTWYDASLYNQERISHGGFEGILYRTVGFGPVSTATTTTDWWGLGTWSSLAVGGPLWFLSGPRKWEPLTVTAQAQVPYPPQSRDLQSYTFTPAGAVANANDGLLLEAVRDTVGFVGQHGGAYWVFTEGGAAVRTEAGDVPPGSQGKVAAVLQAPGTAVARLLAPMGNTTGMDPTGSWRYALWAKGTGTLTVALGDWGHQGPAGAAARSVALTGAWQQITGTMPLTTYPAAWDGNVCFSVHQTGGTAKIDELSVVHEGDQNPTPFRDELVTLLKDLRPGSLRHLQIGGSSLENALRPRASRMAFTKDRGATLADGTWPGHPETNGDADVHSYGLHEFLQLCEEVQTEPWYCTSGTLKQGELAQLVEYLAGPTSTPMGALRAARGHPAPWTDAFSALHVEIGNEAWNSSPAYVNGGFNGQEYWNDLFTSAKASPHYSAKIRLHAGGQAVNTWLNEGLATRHPKADALAVAPYVIHEMSAAEGARSTEELFSWAYGYTWHHARNGYMAENYQKVTQAKGMELSIYEVNHHITGGDAPAAPRNTLVTSLGGALNIANWNLMMMERQKVRTQNLFTLFQKSYNDVRLWGIVLSMRAGQERYRPLYLAARMINRALEGDLVQVTRAGPDPTWDCAYAYDGGPVVGAIPYLHAYATRSGNRRGLVVFNLHRTDSLPIALSLPRPPAGGQAVRYELTGPAVTSDNEPEHAAQVVESQATLTDFANTYRLDVRPHSLTVLTWQE